MDLLLNILTDESNRSFLDDNRWLLIGLGLLAVMYLVVRPLARRKKDPLAGTPRMGLSQQRTVEREMSNLLVELSEMSRQVTAQLDTRAARLEALIAEADERIAALKASNGSNVQRSTFNVQRSTFNVQQADLNPPAAEPDPRHVAVYELADHGRTPDEIAEQLARPKGEIELILALRCKS